MVNPTGPVNGGLVAYLSFYDALGDKCSPELHAARRRPGRRRTSELAVSEMGLVTGLAAQGYAVTVPDFEGTDLHWVAGHESGWSTLDSIRATESYLGMSATQKVGLFGYSGGSIAGEWASELAPSYSPELNIVGTAVGGIPVHLAHNLKYVNGSQSWSGVIPAVLVSLGRAFGINMKQVHQQVREARSAARCATSASASFNGNYPGLRVQHLLKTKYQRFLKIPKIAKTVNKLIMGSAPGRPADADVHGGRQRRRHVATTSWSPRTSRRWPTSTAARALPVQFTVYSGAKHTEAGIQFFPQAMQFLGERFAGAPFAGNCAADRPGQLAGAAEGEEAQAPRQHGGSPLTDRSGSEYAIFNYCWRGYRPTRGDGCRCPRSPSTT